MGDREPEETAPPSRRLEELRRAGGPADPRLPPVFGGPTFRLTPRQPYQPSPEAYLVAWNARVYLPFDDTIVWEPPRDHSGSPLLGLDAYFADSPDGPGMLSIVIAARSWPGVTGHVLVIAFRDAVSVRVPVGPALAARTIELIVPPPGPRALEVAMVIEHGVQALTFRSLSFGPAPPVIGPVMG